MPEYECELFTTQEADSPEEAVQRAREASDELTWLVKNLDTGEETEV